MQKIISISFQGVKRKSPNKIENQAPISNPITKSENNLPVNPANAVMNPTLPSDFLNEKDIERAKLIQKDWAAEMAKKLDVPAEKVIARLSDIELGKADEMLSLGHIGGFDSSKNIILLNPIKEMLNLNGSIERTIAHESTHNLLHALRMAYVEQTTEDQLKSDCKNVVWEKMLNGEHGTLLKGGKLIDLNGQTTFIPEFIKSPPFSQKERQAVINTIKALKEDKHFVPNTEILNESGQEFVKTILLPELDEYSKLFAESPKTADKVAKTIIDYVHSSIFREKFLFAVLQALAKQEPPSKRQIPLNEKELTMAKNAIGDFLSTQEGVRIYQSDSAGIFDDSLKSYFMSYEELFARREETEYKLQQINQKIKNFETKGLSPAKKILQEKETLIVNQRLLDLVDQFALIEQQIISAPKDPQKITELLKNRFHNNPEFVAKLLNNNAKVKKITMISKTEAETKEHMAAEGLEFDEKLSAKIKHYNAISRPENLLADTEENLSLKTQFDKILDQIRELAPKSDLTAIPKLFYKSESEFYKSNEKVRNVIKKCAEILKLRI